MGARLNLTDEQRLERRRAQRRTSAKRRYHEDSEYRARLLASGVRYREKHREDAIRRTREWMAARTPEQLAALGERHNERKKQRRKERGYDPEWLRRESMARTATRYGITRAQYMEMLDAQGGACAICREPETMVIFGRVANLGVDHDHACCPGKRACGKCLRGLLCSKCNTMLGGARDNPAILNAALAYLAAS